MALALYLLVLAATHCELETNFTEPPIDLACPYDIGCLSPQFFDDFGVFQSTFGHDNLEISRQMLHNTYSICMAPHLAFAIDVCPAATLELMLDVVLGMEAELGTDFARNFYSRDRKSVV